MAAAFRPLHLFSLILVTCGCSSSPPGFGGGDGQRSTLERRDEPLFEHEGVDDAATKAARDRALAVARFFATRGIVIEAAPEARCVALDGEGAVIVTIRNGGAKKLTLRGERKVGIWPFRREERARSTLHVRWTQATLAGGLQGGAATLIEDAIGTVVVDAGAEQSIRLPIKFPLAKSIVAARVAVRAEVHPLAIEFEGEPDRVITLPFADMTLDYAPPRVAAAAPDDDAPFRIGLEDDPELLIAAALRASETDAAAAVARLIGSLPGPDAKGRRARLIALEWITQRHLGEDVERWRGWWESDEGMRFGKRVVPAGEKPR